MSTKQKKKRPDNALSKSQVNRPSRPASRRLAVAIDDARPATDRVGRIEGEELVLDGNSGVARRAGSPEAVECTAKFRFKDGARQALAGLCTAMSWPDTPAFRMR